MSGAIHVRPFLSSDMAAIRVQAAQPESAAPTRRQRIAALAEGHGNAFTAIGRDGGDILMIGGAIENHADYASLWAVLSPDAGRHMTALTRKVRQFVAGLPHRRIDATVHAQFEAGCRWLNMLGFVLEAGPLRGAWADGGDALIYVRGGWVR